MSRNLRSATAVMAMIFATIALVVATLGAALLVGTPDAMAQNVDQIVRDLESSGYYIEAGAEGSDSAFANLVRQGEQADDPWYFVSLASPVDEGFADDVRDSVSPLGNVLVYFFDGEFVNVQLASNESESIESRALAPFDGDWLEPEDFMSDVITEFDSLAGSSGSSGSTSDTDSGSSGSSSSGGGFPWAILAIPAVLGGGLWFLSRRGKKRKEEDDLDAAQKIRAELQTELDELANDVLVLSKPVDLSENQDAITYYREATDTYLLISDELPDVEKLEDADLRELSELGARVSHARWQMDAAEAILDGEPIPDKPKVAPPPAPTTPPQPRPEQRRQMPKRQPRPRVPYSPSRRRSGGGLLDILIAGAGMMGSSRRGGGMFGGGNSRRSSRRGGGMFGGGSRNSRGRSGGGMFGGGNSGRSSRSSGPRSGGGVFGTPSRSRSSNRSSQSRSSSRSSSRSRSRSSGRRSTSRRRRR